MNRLSRKATWLYHFLDNPEVIRPWLHYRMPTFPFNDEELATMVEYFQYHDKAPVEFSAAIPDPTMEELESGKTIFTAFQCVKCHKSDPDPMLSASFLAPDLVMAKDRLRPEWVKDWLRDPQAIQEGTMMPTFFSDGETPLPDMMGGDVEAQITAIRDYLWQFDKEEARKLTEGTAAPPAAA